MRKLPLVLALLLLPFLAGAATPKPPGDKEAKALALESCLAFNQAVQAKDFTAFHAQISKLWQDQITPEKLKTVFQTFVDQELDLSVASTLDPVFDEPPKVDSDGLLTLQGNYPTAPNKIQFRLKYVNEKSKWKLLGIKLDVKPAGSTDLKAPSEKEAQALVRESLLAFNRAVQEKSFDGFYQEIAPMWQKQTTPEKLQALFQSFIEAGIDISAIAELDPTFEQPPAVDEDGLLRLKGEYAKDKKRVRFDLAYLSQAADWKLVKIKVKFGSDGEEDEESPNEE